MVRPPGFDQEPAPESRGFSAVPCCPAEQGSRGTRANKCLLIRFQRVKEAGVTIATGITLDETALRELEGSFRGQLIRPRDPGYDEVLPGLQHPVQQR